MSGILIADIVQSQDGDLRKGFGDCVISDFHSFRVLTPPTFSLPILPPGSGKSDLSQVALPQVCLGASHPYSLIFTSSHGEIEAQEEETMAFPRKMECGPEAQW